MKIDRTTTGTDFSRHQLQGQGIKFSIRNYNSCGGSKRPSSSGSSGPKSGEGPAGPSQAELDAAAGLLALGN